MQAFAAKLCHGPVSWEWQETRNHSPQLRSQTPWHGHSDGDRRAYWSPSLTSRREMVWLCLQEVSFHRHGMHPHWQVLPRHPSQQHRGTLSSCGQVLCHHASLRLSTPCAPSCPFPSLLGIGYIQTVHHQGWDSPAGCFWLLWGLPESVLTDITCRRPKRIERRKSFPFAISLAL